MKIAAPTMLPTTSAVAVQMPILRARTGVESVSPVAALMRAEVMRVTPELGRYLQPKCGEHRLGYCDESEKDWAACPIGRVRPHKEVLFRIYEAYRKGETQPLREQDWDVIEEKDLVVLGD